LTAEVDCPESSRAVQEVSKTASKGAKNGTSCTRRPRDHEPLSLGTSHEICCPPPPTLSFTTFAGPKYRKPKMASHDLRARSFEDGCLCSILHGPLQLQIRTTFLLPAYCVRKKSTLHEYWRVWRMLYRRCVGYSLHAKIAGDINDVGTSLRSSPGRFFCPWRAYVSNEGVTL
jgi:hypothetical protein